VREVERVRDEPQRHDAEAVEVCAPLEEDELEAEAPARLRKHVARVVPPLGLRLRVRVEVARKLHARVLRPVAQGRSLAHEHVREAVEHARRRLPDSFDEIGAHENSIQNFLEKRSHANRRALRKCQECVEKSASYVVVGGGKAPAFRGAKENNR
jgi:hypothetical protein